jgi:hypothetical protein
MKPEPKPYVDDPAGWIEDRLGEFIWVSQDEICDAMRTERYVAVQSCHDVGKSWIAARLALWWIDQHEPGEAFVVTTAPTWSQVKAILWREMAKGHRKGGLAGRLTDSAEWKIPMGAGPDQLVALGRKPADYGTDTFQGIHDRYVLVLIDEACGVAKPIWDGVDSIATNEEARVVAIGNPDDPSSQFAQVCKPGSGWKVIRIDALRSPNFTKVEVEKYPNLKAYMARERIRPSTEVVPDDLRPYLVSPLWVEERIKRWGIKSPLFTAKVRGLFPEVTLDTLIEPRWVLAAQRREVEPAPTDPRLGVDVARYGMDHTILLLRQGAHARVVVDIGKGPVTQVAGEVQRVGLAMANPPVANVDDTGVGGGVTDILVANGYPVLPLIAGARCVELLPNGKPRFVDARSEWWWGTREALMGESGTGEDGWLDIDMEDDELAAQLLAPKYFVNQHGQIKVESKDELRKRGLPSPDRADALVYSLVVAVTTGGVIVAEASLTADLMDPRVM